MKSLFGEKEKRKELRKRGKRRKNELRGKRMEGKGDRRKYGNVE